MEEQADCGRGHGGAASIDNTTALCSWGANGHGQLGQGHTEDQLLPVRVPTSLLPGEFQAGASSIGGGGGFSFIVTREGRLLVCGNDDRGQLGLNRPEAAAGRKAPTTSLDFTACSLSASVRIVKAASGWDFMLALSDNGTVYSWGSNSFGQLGRQLDESGKTKQSNNPTPVHFPCKKPQCDIAAGLRHGLSVSADRRVYAWGHGKRGQLGYEVKGEQSNKTFPAFPQEVSIPGSESIKAVFAGMYHSGVLADHGILFLWGCNAYGQCGLQPKESPRVLSPNKISIAYKEKEYVTRVCSGWTHLVACTDKGNLYSWGRANLGQLGRQSVAGFDPVPGLVEGLAHVTSHMCGSEHNVALSASKMYAWGWNEHGICATGDEENVPYPRLVSSLGQDSVVTALGCGAGHTFCMVQHGSQ